LVKRKKKITSSKVTKRDRQDLLSIMRGRPDLVKDKKLKKMAIKEVWLTRVEFDIFEKRLKDIEDELEYEDSLEEYED